MTQPVTSTGQETSPEAPDDAPGNLQPSAGLPELLRTSVVGSYSVPDWLGRFKTEFHRGRLSRAGLREIEEVAIRAAVVDQTLAGVDIISDGEYGRDNDMDYLVEAIAGIEVDGGPKHHYLDYLDAVVRRPLPESGEIAIGGLVSDFSFVRSLTDKVITVSLAGPLSLAERIRNEAYEDPRDLLGALARVLNRACRDLVEAGATHLQIDEPFLAGYPEMAAAAIDSLEAVTEGVDAHVALHVCYGNRYARPAWEGHYDFLFPAVCEAPVDELVLEFGRKGLDDLHLVRRYPGSFEVGIGIVDVKSREVEPVEVVESRLHQALKIVPVERVVVNPDCGLRHLPLEVARRKLATMVIAARNVRADVLGTRERFRRPAVHALARPNGPAPAPERNETAGAPGRLDLLGVGNAIVDMLVEVNHGVVESFGLEPRSMTLVDDDTAERMTTAAGFTRGSSGGSAANTAVGIVGLGGSAGFVGRVAGDPVGDVFAEDLRDAGVVFEVDSRPALAPGERRGTGRCLVLVTPDSERTMATYLGASSLLGPGDLDPALFSRAQVVYLEGYLCDAPAGYAVLRQAAELARRSGSKLALSLSDSFCVDRHRELFLELGEAADVVFANEAEASLLANGDLDRALELFAELGGVSAVTLGARGSIVLAGGDRVHVPATPVERVVDTTGAGDLYAAGFLHAWTRGSDLDLCGALGAVTAAEVVGHLGARPRRPLLEALVEHSFHERLLMAAVATSTTTQRATTHRATSALADERP